LSGVASSASMVVHTTGYSCMHEGMHKSASGARFRRRCLTDDSFSLYLNCVFPDQARDLKQCICRSHGSEVSTMHPGNRLPVVCIAEIDTGSDCVRERSAQRGDARCDLIQDEDRLPFGIAWTDDFTCAVGGRGSANKDARLCREFWMRTERGPFRPKFLRSQDVELLGEGEL
jgi:hypothetical protein